MASYKVTATKHTPEGVKPGHISYRGKRINYGEVVDDIPADSVQWLVKRGAIEKVDKPKRKPATKQKKESDEAGDD